MGLVGLGCPVGCCCVAGMRMLLGSYHGTLLQRYHSFLNLSYATCEGELCCTDGSWWSSCMAVAAAALRPPLARKSPRSRPAGTAPNHGCQLHAIALSRTSAWQLHCCCCIDTSRAAQGSMAPHLQQQHKHMSRRHSLRRCACSSYCRLQRGCLDVHHCTTTQLPQLHLWQSLL